jgi:uncharacterized protein
MRLFFLLCIVALVVWFWRSSKSSQANSSATQPKEKSPGANAEVKEMRSCQHCGLHMPAPDMVRGSAGLYCCAEHQQIAER